MKFLFRADASNQIGYGHLIRSLSLADAVKDAGGEPVFYIHGDKSAWGIVKERKHNLINRFASTNEVKEEKYLNTILSEFEWFVLDSYRVSSEYMKFLKDAGKKILLIDDLADREIFADIILNQNTNAFSLKYKFDNANTKLLFGPKYSLLRREFLNIKPASPRKKVEKLLVTMGAADPVNATYKIVDLLNKMNLNIDIDVIMGPAYRFKQQLKELKVDFKFNLYENVSDMWNYMNAADIIINAGGTTNYEIAYLGKPNIIVVLADNQQLAAEKLDKDGVSINLGWYNQISFDKFEYAVNKLISDFSLRQKMFENSVKLVDGRGAERVAEEMLSANPRE